MNIGDILNDNIDGFELRDDRDNQIYTFYGVFLTSHELPNGLIFELYFTDGHKPVVYRFDRDTGLGQVEIFNSIHEFLEEAKDSEILRILCLESGAEEFEDPFVVLV